MERLTDEQRALVENNMGLVHVHLSRHVDPRAAATRDREVDDLYQEGMLGLIRASSSYDPEQHGHFVPYALARIKSAVSQAFYEGFSTLRVPAKVRRRAARARRIEGAATSDPTDTVPTDTVPTDTVPNLVALGEIQHRLASPERDTCRVLPGEASEPTLRQRLGELYTAAVEAAVAAWHRSHRRTAGRSELVTRVVRDRLSIPEADERTPLRQIARDLETSGSRVLNCERFLVRQIARQLEDDPEYLMLRRTVRTEAEDWDSAMDDGFRQAVRQARRDMLLARFRRMDDGGQGAFLGRLARMAEGTVDQLAAELLRRLSDEQLQSLVAQPLPSASEVGRPRPRRAQRSNDPSSRDSIVPAQDEPARRPRDPAARSSDATRTGRSSLDQVRTTP